MEHLGAILSGISSLILTGVVVYMAFDIHKHIKEIRDKAEEARKKAEKEMKK